MNRIPYKLKRSNRRKTIAIAVDSNGVSMTAPTNTTQEKKIRRCTKSTLDSCSNKAF